MYWLPIRMGPGCRADSCLLRPGEESERGWQWTGHPAPLLVLSQLCRPPAWGPEQGRGQECFSRSLVLEGLTVCPSCQDLPDPVHDAAEVQLPHGGSAFHDETGEETCLPDVPRLLPASGRLPRLLPLWSTLPVAPLCPGLPFSLLSLPGLWEPCEGRTILASALCPGLIQ